MAKLDGFDANKVEPAMDFEPLPAGTYTMVIVDSEEKPTKRGDGHNVQLKLQVIEGQYQNRLLWDHLSLDNPNPVAVQLGRAKLSAICRSVGVMQPEDSVELHNLPLLVKVKCKQRTDTREMVNEVKGYEKKDGAQNEPPPAPPNTPPWPGK